jgi:phosphatidylglycerol:prolipoprotein diacylglycerol transferase
MSPILAELRVGDHVLVVHAYGTFMMLAWAVVLTVGTLVARRRGDSWWRVLSVLAISLVAAIVGARVLDLAVDWSFYSEDLSRIYGLEFHGFSLYGGLILAAGAGYLASRAFALSPWRLADGAVPAIAAGIVFARIGCFLNGCCFGTVTDLPWGVTYPAGSGAWAQQILGGQTGLLGMTGMVRPVHPTQLYEALAAIVMGAVALGLLSRRDPRGKGRFPAGASFMAFALGFTLFRLGNDFLRVQPPTASMPLWFNPVLHLAVSAGILGVIITLTCRRLPLSRPSAA